MQLDLTIDEHWPRDEYGRVAGLRDARFLQVRDIELSRKDLELLSNMPGVTDVVFDNATLPEGDLANLNVGTLQYWRCDVGQPEIDKILSQRNIDCLGLHDVELKASLFESFSRLPKLQSLLLSKTDLSDLDISKCKALTWMRLSNSELDDDGIAKLAGQNTERLKSVASSVIVGLSLAGNPITDTCVDDLLKFASVTDLDVTGTKLSAAGIRKLRAAMPLSKIHADEDVWTEAVYGPVE
jgi:hypothetical protein